MLVLFSSYKCSYHCLFMNGFTIMVFDRIHSLSISTAAVGMVNLIIDFGWPCVAHSNKLWGKRNLNDSYGFFLIWQFHSSMCCQCTWSFWALSSTRSSSLRSWAWVLREKIRQKAYPSLTRMSLFWFVTSLLSSCRFFSCFPSMLTLVWQFSLSYIPWPKLKMY